MKTKVTLRQASLAIGLLASSMFISSLRAADPSANSSKWEIAGTGQALRSNTSSVTVGTLKVGGEFTSIRLGGVVFGYRLTDGFQANAYLSAGNGTLKASALNVSASDDVTVGEYGVGVDYSLMPKSVFTPIIGLQVGAFSFGGIGSETDLQLGGSAGFRYDFSEKFFMKGVYRMTWTKYAGFEDRTRISGVNLAVGYRF